MPNGPRWRRWRCRWAIPRRKRRARNWRTLASTFFRPPAVGGRPLFLRLPPPAGSRVHGRAGPAGGGRTCGHRNTPTLINVAGQPLVSMGRRRRQPLVANTSGAVENPRGWITTARNSGAHSLPPRGSACRPTSAVSAPCRRCPRASASRPTVRRTPRRTHPGAGPGGAHGAGGTKEAVNRVMANLGVALAAWQRRLQFAAIRRSTASPPRWPTTRTRRRMKPSAAAPGAGSNCSSARRNARFATAASDFSNQGVP